VQVGRRSVLLDTRVYKCLLVHVKKRSTTNDRWTSRDNGTVGSSCCCWEPVGLYSATQLSGYGVGCAVASMTDDIWVARQRDIWYIRRRSSCFCSHVEGVVKAVVVWHSLLLKNRAEPVFSISGPSIRNAISETVRHARQMLATTFKRRPKPHYFSRRQQSCQRLNVLPTVLLF